MKVPPGTLYMRLAYVNACQGLGYLPIVCPRAEESSGSFRQGFIVCSLHEEGLFTAVWTFELRI